jgi:capsular exopolysaccharide synthesis family protein
MNDSTAPDRRRGFQSYLRAVRRRRVLVLVILAVFVGISLVRSFTADTTYEAASTILFQDPNEDLSLTGASGGVFRTAQERAQIGADTLITDRLAADVRSRLRLRESIDGIKGDLAAAADPATSQVTITAKADTARGAADLANAVSVITQQTEADASRARYLGAARNLARRSDRLGNSDEDDNQRLEYAQQISRLRTLSTLTAPVQITKTASIPSSPASPKPVSSAILFFILGLFVAVPVALAREAFDRTIETTTDVEDQIGVPVLVHLSSDAMGRAGLSSHGLGALQEPDQESLRILRTNLRVEDPDDPPQVVLVTSPMPSEGKSTVAASLAFSNALAGRSTLLVECDFRRPTLAERLGVAKEPGLVDYLTGRAEPQEIIQTVEGSTVERGAPGYDGDVESPGLVAIVAGSVPGRWSADLIEGGAFKDFIDEVRGAYDSIVIDTPPLLPVADALEMIPQVDSVVLCLRASRTTRDQASRARAALEPFKEKLAGAVITDVRSRDRGDYGYYGYYGYASAEPPKAQPASRSRLFGRRA